MSEVAPPTYNDAPDSARPGEGVRNRAPSEVNRNHMQPTAPSLLAPLSATGLRNTRMMHLLERIAAKFNDADVPLIVLKGGALNLTVYERLHQRPMDDLDLLIRPEDVDRALGLIEELGGQRGESQVRGDFFPRFHYETEYTIGSIHPVKIDLHVRPFRPLRYAQIVPKDAFQARSTPVPIGRTTILIPSTEEMLIHLTVHAAIHGCARRMWLEDIRLWIAAYREELDWDRFVTTVNRWRLALPVRIALQRVETQFGPVCPPSVSQTLSSTRVSWCDRLALRQAPRDAGHPASHIAVNVLCTPGWRFKIGYLRAMLFPDRSYMAHWYGRNHRGWLPIAHGLRCLGPIVACLHIKRHRSPDREAGPGSTRESEVLAKRDKDGSEVVAQGYGKKSDSGGAPDIKAKETTLPSENGLPATPLRRDDVAFHELDGEALIYDPVCGAVHRFNATTLFVWNACDGLHTTKDISRVLMEQSAVERDDAPAIVGQVITELSRLGLLKDSPAPATDFCPSEFQDAQAADFSPREILEIEGASTPESSRRLKPAARVRERRQEHAHGSVNMARGLSRRELLSGGVTKAILAAPVISTFFATGAFASGPSASGAFGVGNCKEVGYSCTTDPNCCDNSSVTDCEAGKCCIRATKTGCTTDDDCCAAAASGCIAGTCTL